MRQHKRRPETPVQEEPEAAQARSDFDEVDALVDEIDRAIKEHDIRREAEDRSLFAAKIKTVGIASRSGHQEDCGGCPSWAGELGAVLDKLGY